MTLPAFNFKPSVHGFKFVNNFSGYQLAFSMPKLPRLSTVSSSYGLCGGMSCAAYDFLLSGRTIPPVTTPPAKGSILHQYLYRRQIDTFGAVGEQIVQFARWMIRPDDTIVGTQKRTYDEFAAIRTKLDAGSAVVLGLVYVSGSNSLEIWKNHQVLAYGYSEVSPTTINIYIYDPNYPQLDDITIRLERIIVGTTLVPSVPPRKKTVFGFRCTQKLPNRTQNIRGFFAIPYVPAVPPVFP